MSVLSELDRRVLIFAPAGRDAELARSVLANASITAAVCPSIESFCDELSLGAALGILTEEALTPQRRSPLIAALASQPLWADFPLIVLAARSRSEQGRLPVERAIHELGNSTLLERPLHPDALVGAVRSALRARDRQYQSRELLSRLEQAVTERDRFLATLSHELRNPLGAIRSAVRLASITLPPGSSLERPIGIVNRQVTHLARLIDDLLDVSRVTTGKVSLTKVPVDVRVVIQQAVQQLDSEFAHHRLHASSSLGDEPLWVEGDPVRLEQVITNLLTNSIKYTPEGGRVDVTAGRDAEGIWARVADTGVGIEASVLPGIFDLFTQADSSLARSQGGMGIGLTLVKSLVELHGGAVAASSAGLGQGSAFTVRLPYAEPALVRSNEIVERPRPRGPKRILLVEDNEDNREMLRELLELDGFHVEVACDGSQAISQALASKPDVAIVDIGLPVVDGYEVARRVRAALGSTIQLVALTGYGQPDDRHRTADAGFDAHLTKPVHLEDLEAALAQGS